MNLRLNASCQPQLVILSCLEVTQGFAIMPASRACTCHIPTGCGNVTNLAYRSCLGFFAAFLLPLLLTPCSLRRESDISAAGSCLSGNKQSLMLHSALQHAPAMANAGVPRTTATGTMSCARSWRQLLQQAEDEFKSSARDNHEPEALRGITVSRCTCSSRRLGNRRRDGPRCSPKPTPAPALPASPLAAPTPLTGAAHLARNSECEGEENFSLHLKCRLQVTLVPVIRKAAVLNSCSQRADLVTVQEADEGHSCVLGECRKHSSVCAPLAPCCELDVTCSLCASEFRHNRGETFRHLDRNALSDSMRSKGRQCGPWLGHRSKPAAAPAELPPHCPSPFRHSKIISLLHFDEA